MAKLELFWCYIGLCKLRCFPPIAFAWDETSGLHLFPNLFSERIVVDSSPALWSSAPGSEKTNVLLLVIVTLLPYGGNSNTVIGIFFFFLIFPIKDLSM